MSSDAVVSYDLQVWTTRKPDFPTALPDSAQWQERNDVWVWARHGWQVVAGPVHVVNQGDVPPDVRTSLPGISHMIELNLEPAAAPQSAHGLLRRAANALAVAGHGAVFDPQVDLVTTPAGVRRYVSPAVAASLTALQMSWFSVDAVMASRAGFEGIVDCLERDLPEALPVRYGQYEPPSFRYAETGRLHFVEFLADEYLKPGSLGFVVWYPKRPVLNVNLTIGVGGSPAGWRCHRLTLTLDASVLHQSGWPSALQQLWRRMTRIVGAFYSDVRLLQRYRHGRASVYELMDAERHPVCGPFWAGIPRDGACALALGEPYLSRWPEFGAVAEREGDIGFLTRPAWADRSHGLMSMTPVPDRLAQQSPAYDELGPNLNRKYPIDWPFSGNGIRPAAAPARSPSLLQRLIGSLRARRAGR